MESGIYQILNIKTNKSYIGSSINIKRRLYDHKRKLQRGKHINKYLQRAWDKYGEENFEFNIILYCSKDELLIEEQKRIIISKNKSYNLCPIAGNTLGRSCSKLTKRKISKANKGKVRTKELIEHLSKIRKGHRGWNKGMIVSLETRKKLSIAGKGRIVSKETRKKLSEANKGNKYPPVSEETRKKISEANKGHIAWNKGLSAWNKGQKGLYKASKETRQKMKESQRKRWIINKSNSS